MKTEPGRSGTTALHEDGPRNDAELRGTGPTPVGGPETSALSVPALTAAEVFAALNGSPRGLSAAEAGARRVRYGPNELPGVGRGHVWRRLAAQRIAEMEETLSVL
ncbi:cation-transporting P-type ATPase [Streptomyces sp. NPDC058464]|uniref:cation-transporting P-type ATPase n=1 Tax=Streptomyces sp. NPDC058464 TaxID=3346511 RepID=UPI00366284A5